eukprot:s1152_g22.t1
MKGTKGYRQYSVLAVWHLRHWAGSRDGLGCCWSRVGPRLFCVAGVARFVWQAWHLRHWAGSGDSLGRRWSRVAPRLFCVAGVALAALGWVCLRFVWQAWNLVTWTFTLCGRRGTYGSGLGLVTWPRLFCVAGVALGDICLRFVWQALALAGICLPFVWQAWHLRHWAGDGLDLRWSRVAPRLFCVGGVVLGICLRFVWQAWHLVTSAFVLCGMRGTC